MDLSFYSVISYRGASVAIVVVGQQGAHFRSIDLAGLPRAQAAFVDVVFEQLAERSSVRELRRLRARLGDGLTQLSEPQPVTFDSVEQVLSDLVKRFLPARAA